MLEKPWKSLLLSALYELQIPSDEDDSAPSQIMRSRSTSRSRRGVSNNAGPLQWLPETSEVLISGSGSDAYRLAILLIRKSLFSDDWDESNDESVEDLRNNCATNRVHPVWHKMAESTPILAQFMSFPKSESDEKISDEIDSSSAFIDPSNSNSLSKTLSSLEAEIKLILKKDKFELLDKLDLADYFIVSKAEKELSNNDDIKIEVKKAQGQKCERCWKILEKKCERESCPIK